MIHKFYMTVTLWGYQEHLTESFLGLVWILVASQVLKFVRMDIGFIYISLKLDISDAKCKILLLVCYVLDTDSFNLH